MKLFRRNDNTPIKFDVIGLDGEEFDEIKQIVSENGGVVEHCHEQPIKFIKTYMFLGCAFPMAKLYNINYITDCVCSGSIIDPTPYRLGTPMLYDEYVMSIFLYGTCTSCAILPFTNEGSNSRPRYLGAQDLDPSSNSCDPESLCSPRAIRKTRSAEAATSEKRYREASPSQSEDSNSNTGKSRNRQEYKARTGRGSQFTFTDDKRLVMYLVDNDLIGQARKGLRVWQSMIKKKVCTNRAATSLYGRFHQKILPNIEKFGLTEAQLQEFQKMM